MFQFGSEAKLARVRVSQGHVVGRFVSVVNLHQCPKNLLLDIILSQSGLRACCDVN